MQQGQEASPLCGCICALVSVQEPRCSNNVCAGVARRRPFSRLLGRMLQLHAQCSCTFSRCLTVLIRINRRFLPPHFLAGRILRWQRRFFAASEAPGVVMIYKRMNMKGKVWTSTCIATPYAISQNLPSSG